MAHKLCGLESKVRLQYCYLHPDVGDLNLVKTCNLLDSNVDHISDALFILGILYEYTQTQCGAIDVNNI